LRSPKQKWIRFSFRFFDFLVASSPQTTGDFAFSSCDGALRMTDSSTSSISELLKKCTCGEVGAENALLTRVQSRFRQLVARMLHSFPRLGNVIELDDVIQNASLRLLTALREVGPSSKVHFVNLASLQIRRELTDLHRRYYGPHGWGTNCVSLSDNDSAEMLLNQPDSSYNPEKLARWGDFHEQVEKLCDEERAVVDRLFYLGMSQDEAASELKVSVPTIKRRWRDARLNLAAALGGAPFDP
jgi:RNA polymerase sigma factor (sigma-70 family)